MSDLDWIVVYVLEKPGVIFISSGARIVSGKARFGSSESLGKSSAREFG